MLQNPVILNATLGTTLQICSGLFWTITYILIIRRGFKDQTYGMPMVAICANVSWEFIFAFIYPHPTPQLYIDYLWLLFDLGIVVQYLRYGRKSFPVHLPSNLFYPAFFFTLLFAGLTIVLMSVEFNEYIGIYAAFAQNLMMSILFVRLLLKRNSSGGQSLYIALAKMVGTLFPSLLFYLYFPHSFLLVWLYITIFVFDVLYFLLLYFQLKKEDIAPWRRV